MAMETHSKRRETKKDALINKYLLALVAVVLVLILVLLLVVAVVVMSVGRIRS